MPKVTFAPGAAEELVGAATYYEAQQAGLGAHFLDNVDEAVRDIVAHPQAWTVLDGDLRRHALRRFPYAIIFRQYRQTIRILAVMHLHRAPGYWRDRT